MENSLHQYDAAYLKEKKQEFLAVFEGIRQERIEDPGVDIEYRYTLTENWEGEGWLFFILWEDFARKHYKDLGIDREFYDIGETMPEHEMKHLRTLVNLGVLPTDCKAEIKLYDNHVRHSCSYPKNTDPKIIFFACMAVDEPSFNDIFDAGRIFYSGVIDVDTLPEDLKLKCLKYWDINYIKRPRTEFLDEG